MEFAGACKVGFTQFIYFNSKERGWVSPYTGLKRAEQISESAALTHVEDSRCIPGRDSAKLVHIHQSKGCIFSRPNSTPSQSVPALCIQRAGLSVQGAPIRPISSPTGLHKVHTGSSGPNTSQRHTSPPIFGRLADLRSNPGTGRAGHHSPTGPCITVGSGSQLCKELSCTQSKGWVPRHVPGLHLLRQFQIDRKVKYSLVLRLLGMLTSVTAIVPLGLLHMRPFQIWTGVLHLDPWLHRSRKVRVSSRCLMALRPWRDRAYLVRGVTLGSIPSRREVVVTDASLSGCSLATQSSERALECSGTTHKCARAPCYTFSAPQIPAIFERQTCFDTLREQVSCLQCQPPRGHQVDTVITGCGLSLIFTASGLCICQGHRTLWRIFSPARNLLRRNGDSTQR